MGSRIRPAVAAIALAVVTTAMVPVVAFAGDEDAQPEAVGCANQLDDALRQDMESFRDFDAEAFRAGHDERAVTVFPSGRIAVGVEEIMRLLGPHFQNRNAVWTWTELGRVVEGCKAAFVYYDATYAIPSQGFSQHQRVATTWTREGGSWLAIADTNTLAP